MPFDTDKTPKRVIEAAKQRNLVPLVGAGISRQAGDAFPNWIELLKFMKERALAGEFITDTEASEMDVLLADGKLLMVAEALRTSLPPDEYESILEEKFRPIGVKPAEIHTALFRLRPPLILTTNYDLLLEDAYAYEYEQAPNVYTYRDAPVVQRSLQTSRVTERPVIFKLHGSIDEPSELILSERDYRRLIYQQTGYRSLLSALFITHVVVMLGFSFSDRELMLLLETLRESLKHRNNPDFIFLPADSAGRVEARRLREDFGIQVIPYEPSEGHPEVLQFINFLISQIDVNNNVSSG